MLPCRDGCSEVARWRWTSRLRRRRRAWAKRVGVSLSAWLNVAAERALVIERGLAGVAEWEAEHGALSTEELAWADSVLDRSVTGPAAS